MKKQLVIWQLISSSLQRKIPVMLLYVVQSKGSSPGRQGFFMAINRDGDMCGSIGGGIMENKFVEMAKEKLQHQAGELSLRKQFHDKKAVKNQSGMICSGEQTICMYRARDEDHEQVDLLIDSLTKGLHGSLEISAKGFNFSTTCPDQDYSFSFVSDDNWQYIEKTGYKNRLYIIGAGHCALALSRIMSTMDFFITLYDDRQDLPTFSENIFVHCKHLIDDYQQLQKLLPPGENHYVVVMTVGYRTDDIVIRSLMNMNFAYLGLLGSRKKIEKMFSDYRLEGIAEGILQKIHAPVGIPVNSQTPEEIAVSVAAQIVQVKNQRLQ
jgi:xanthine dehydrogenase accessory factor